MEKVGSQINFWCIDHFLEHWLFRSSGNWRLQQHPSVFWQAIELSDLKLICHPVFAVWRRDRIKRFKDFFLKEATWCECGENTGRMTVTVWEVKFDIRVETRTTRVKHMCFFRLYWTCPTCRHLNARPLVVWTNLNSTVLFRNHMVVVFCYIPEEFSTGNRLCIPDSLGFCITLRLINLLRSSSFTIQLLV